jgi:hypothetical protein
VLKTRAAFVPPKPKLFESTALGPCGSCKGSPATNPASNGGSGSLRLTVGGATPCHNASSVKMPSTAPAAPRRWPVAPLVEDTAMGGLPDVEAGAVAASPKTDAIARCSMSSPGVGGAEVPELVCPLCLHEEWTWAMLCFAPPCPPHLPLTLRRGGGVGIDVAHIAWGQPSLNQRPPHCQLRTHAVGRRLSDVVRVPGEPVAAHLWGHQGGCGAAVAGQGSAHPQQW